MSYPQAQLQKAVGAAAAMTGRKFGLLVASSLLATAAIVASAMSGNGGIGPLAEAAARSLLEEHPAALASAPATTAVPEAIPEPPPSGTARPAGPVTAGDPPPPATAQEGVPPTAPPAGGPEPEEPAAEPKTPEAGPIQHVFLISLASPGYEVAFGSTSQMPYLATTLRPQGVLLTNYSLLAEAALPNSFGAIAGQKPTAASEGDCPAYEKCLFQVETPTLADQLDAGRFTWHAYLEGMADETGEPANCVHPEPGAAEVPVTGGYGVKLNPFVYFHSLLDLGDCATNDVPLTELAKDLKKADSTANFSYIAPDLCNAGFRGQCPEGTADGAAAADAYLQKVVPEILASPAYKKDGLLMVSFGATDPAAAEAPGATAESDPLRVGALLASPLLPSGGTDGARYTPYSLLRSIDELFGLEPLGKAGGGEVHSFASAFIAQETAAGD